METTQGQRNPHQSFWLRRAYIKAFIDSGKPIANSVKHILRNIFGASDGNISADIIAVKYPEGGYHITPSMKKKIFARDGHKCRYCGNTQARRYIIEHVVPASQGGKATEDNLVVACQQCNTRKRYDNKKFQDLLK